MSKNKFEIQNNQYEFPYHYLSFMENNTPQIKRTLSWGYEYLSYMKVVLDEIKKLNPKSILDVGCGDGYLLNNLDLNCEKYGVDLSQKAILFAQAFSKDTKFEYKDIFDIDEKFDLVSLIEVLEHIPDEVVPTFMQRTLNLVAEGGYFVISVPTTVTPVNKKHYRHYDENLLDSHILKYAKVELVKEMRVYKTTEISKIIHRFLNNKIWTINSKKVLSKFWKWHLKNNLFADKNSGQHLIRVYRRIQ